MSISSQISRISKNVTDSLAAVANKGVTVPSGSTSDDLPDLIAQITGGGAGGFTITDTVDSNGGIIRTITGVEISGTKSITENGTNIDVTAYEKVNVAVPTGIDCPTFTVTINGSLVIQSVTCDKTYAECTGYLQNGVCEAIIVLTNGTETTSYGASYVDGDSNTTLLYAMTGMGDVVNLIVSIDSSSNANGTLDPIPYRDSTDLSASGATVTVPSGYYESQATKSVDSMTLPTAAAASATSGYTSKATISRSTSDQYINIPTGYNSAGAYYKVNAVANGTVTAPSSISGTSATVSTGTNTLTLTKSVSVTPSISTAGYVSSGTAGNSTVTLTASVTTKAATTYYPSSSDQSISGSQYLTGAQTIKGVTVSGLSADKILSGTTVKIGDSSDDDRIASVSGSVVIQTYYTGSSVPSSSLGVNGDIYLKTS